MFGFISRYPSDKTSITGVMSEPWHYRYVGVDAATSMYSQGICLEEYLNMSILVESDSLSDRLNNPMSEMVSLRSR